MPRTHRRPALASSAVAVALALALAIGVGCSSFSEEPGAPSSPSDDAGTAGDGPALDAAPDMPGADGAAEGHPVSIAGGLPSCSHLAVSGTSLFVLTTDGDVLRTTLGASTPAPVSFLSGLGATSIAAAGSKLFVVGNGGLMAYGITPPAMLGNTVMVDTPTDVVATINAVAVLGDGTPTGLFVFDASLMPIAHIYGGIPRAAAPDVNAAYVALGSSMDVERVTLDGSSRTTKSMVDGALSMTTALESDTHFVYAGFGNTIRKYDVTTILQPVTVAVFDSAETVAAINAGPLDEVFVTRSQSTMRARVSHLATGKDASVAPALLGAIDDCNVADADFDKTTVYVLCTSYKSPGTSAVWAVPRL